jgi:transposase
MKKKKKKSSAKRGSRTWAYPVEVRRRIVKLFLEEEYSTSLLSEQFSISRSAIRRWVRLYRQRGVEGLEVKPRAGGNTRVTPEVRQRMVAVKEAHPEYGPRRIADVLKRFFLIPTSQSTVHKTLSGRGLVDKAKRKPVKNPSQPRFFERSRPNQLWQSDISGRGKPPVLLNWRVHRYYMKYLIIVPKLTIYLDRALCMPIVLVSIQSS